MTKFQLVKKTMEESLGYDIVFAEQEGMVVEIDTKDGEHIGVLIIEHQKKIADAPCFSLSMEAVISARACQCAYVANFFGSNACAIVAVDAPDYESFDEWGHVVHTYANPLLDD